MKSFIAAAIPSLSSEGCINVPITVWHMAESGVCIVHPPHRNAIFVCKFMAIVETRYHLEIPRIVSDSPHGGMKIVVCSIPQRQNCDVANQMQSEARYEWIGNESPIYCWTVRTLMIVGDGIVQRSVLVRIE